MARRGAGALSRSARQPTRLLTALAVTLLYVLFVAYVASHHEMWRDEVRALNIAAGARSLGELTGLLHNEGHPLLWYLLLHAAFRLTHSMLLLKPLTLACAAAAAWVLLRYGPFPTWQKILFLCGAYPLYEYAVLCRDYALSTLLLFGAAALWKRRFSRPLPLLVVLLLLANTNAYALFIACALAIALALEGIVVRPRLETRAKAELSAGVALLLLGIVVSISTMIPDETSSVATLGAHGAREVAGAFLGALLAPASLYAFLAGGEKLLVNVLFWVLAASFLPRPWLVAAWIANALAFSAFSALVYEADPLQRGLFYVFFVALLWIERGDEGDGLRLPAWLSPLRRGALGVRLAVGAALLVTQAFFAVGLVGRDLGAALSSSASLGAYLTRSPELRQAIVIPEPAVMAEALPYYAPNRIYLPREGKDMIQVRFTRDARSELSLDELLEIATRMKAQSGREVLLLIGHRLSPEGPFVIRYPYALEFRYTPESLERFASRTLHLATFDRAQSDENYVLFRVR